MTGEDKITILQALDDIALDYGGLWAPVNEKGQSFTPTEEVELRECALAQLNEMKTIIEKQ